MLSIQSHTFTLSLTLCTYRDMKNYIIVIVKVKQIDVEFQWQYTVYVLRSSETIKGLEKITVLLVCMLLLSFCIDYRPKMHKKLFLEHLKMNHHF